MQSILNILENVLISEVGAIRGSPEKSPASQEIGPETRRKGERSFAGRRSCIMTRPDRESGGSATEAGEKETKREWGKGLL